MRYQTDSPVDLDQVASILLGNMEFPLDGSDPFPADVPENLYPFTCTEIIPGENHFFRFPVEELCQKLGADYQWDETTQTATATYRGVTLTMTVGESCYQANGETVELSYKVRTDPIFGLSGLPPVYRPGGRRAHRAGQCTGSLDFGLPALERC